MTEDITLTNHEKVLNDIIDNATELPLDSQEVVLLIAKSMRYARECVMSKYDVE